MFLEIGTDKDHVHLLVQTVPKLSPTDIVRTIKSITAKQIFVECPEVKKKLWGGEFWSDGFYVATVSEHGNEETIANYVRNQGNEYRKLYRVEDAGEGQLSLLDYFYREALTILIPRFRNLAEQGERQAPCSVKARMCRSRYMCLRALPRGSSLSIHYL